MLQRETGHCGAEAAARVGEPGPARDRVLRSDRLYRSAGVVPTFSAGSPYKIFSVVAGGLGVLHTSLAWRSGHAEPGLAAIVAGDCDWPRRGAVAVFRFGDA